MKYDLVLTEGQWCSLSKKLTACQKVAEFVTSHVWVWYGIVVFNIPLDTLQVISEKKVVCGLTPYRMVSAWVLDYIYILPLRIQ